MKYEDKMSVGDKLIYYAALKGVVKEIFPEGKEPYSQYRPDEKIHSMESVSGVNGRMVTSILITGAINKLMIDYNTFGSKGHIGEMGHKSVINALRRFKEFLLENK